MCYCMLVSIAYWFSRIYWTKTNEMKVGRHRDMMGNHITIGSNSYEKVKNLSLFRLFTDKSQFYYEEIKCSLKQDIHIIIQSK